MHVELPEVYFDIRVDYTDDPDTYKVEISLGGVTLMSRHFTSDYTKARVFREQHKHMPDWYAEDAEDAKDKAITMFGKELRNALQANMIIAT